MDHPDEPSKFSSAPSGDVQPKPSKIISVVVTDKEQNPVGILEKWSSEAWFYAEEDDLMDLN